MLKQLSPFHSSTFIIISLFFMAIMKTLTFCVTRTAESTLRLQVPEDTRHTTGTSLPATRNTYTVQIHDPPTPQSFWVTVINTLFIMFPFFSFFFLTIIQITAILKRQDFKKIHHWPDYQILQFLSPCLLMFRTRTKTQKERTNDYETSPAPVQTHACIQQQVSWKQEKMHLNYN